MPLIERACFAAELRLVGIIADREILNPVAGIERGAQCILDRQQPDREPAVTRQSESDQEQRERAAVHDAEHHRGRLPREIKTERTRGAVRCAFEGDSAVESEHRLALEHVARAALLESLRTKLPQRLE